MDQARTETLMDDFVHSHSSPQAAALPPFDVRSALDAVLKGKWILLEICILFFLFALVFVHLQAPLYTATAIVAPQETNQNAMQSGSSALQALSSLSGLDVGKGGGMDEFVQLLDTPSVAALMQRRDGVLQKLFPASWDPQANRWRKPEGIRAGIKSALNWLLGLPPPTDPDAFTLAGYVSKNVIVNKIRSSNLTSLEYSSRTPGFSVSFLTAVCNAADSSMREAAKRRAAWNVRFLQEKLEVVQSAELKTALINLLEQQEKALMLASSGDTYAFRFVQPPLASNSPTWPAAFRIFAVAIMAAISFGTILVLYLFWAEGARPLPGFLEGIRHRKSLSGFLLSA
jgi:hypothetical protein